VSPTDALIKTGLSFEFVSQAHKEFLEFEKLTIVPQWFEEHMYELAYEIRECSELSEVYQCLKKAVKSHIEFEKLKYPCYVCEEPMRIGQTEWPGVKELLISKKWKHAKCVA